MILSQNPETGYWTDVLDPRGERLGSLTGVHDPESCQGRLCDVHNRRGEKPWSEWPLNWRSDRGMMEVISPSGIGHPTPAQYQYWLTRYSVEDTEALMVHGCDGSCGGSYED